MYILPGCKTTTAEGHPDSGSEWTAPIGERAGNVLIIRFMTTQNTLKNEQPPKKEEVNSPRLFGKFNFICMAICLALIILGFVLMAGPGSSVEQGFNPDIFSTRRIVIAPTICFLGFVLMAFAIIINPEKVRRKFNKKKDGLD